MRNGRKNMSNLKSKIAIALALVILAFFVAPVWAVDYTPGVSAGQWVRYGNFVGVGTGTEEMNKTDWAKVDVVAVSGKSVTLHMSGKYKNGSDAKQSGYIINVETGTINGSSLATGGSFFVSAANLAEGDPLASGSPFKINKTETRSYMGVSRTVNILNYTYSIFGYGVKWITVWDKVSGILLEMSLSTSILTTEKISFSATDTNIYATGVTGWLMDNMIYIVIAVIVIVIIVVAAAMMMRKKPQALSPSETKESTTASET